MFSGGLGNILHQRRDLIRNLFDFLECGARIFRQQRTPDNVGCASFHRHHGLVRITLDCADQHFDLFRRIRRTLGKTLHLIGNNRKPSPGITCHRSLYGCIQSQYICLIGDIVDELDNIADLLGTLTQPFDSFGSILNRFTYGIHSGNRAPNRITPLVRHVN